MPSIDNLKISQQYKYFSTIAMVYCTVLILSVLFPYKIINFFGFDEPVGVFILPINYLFGSALAEVYGRKMALRMMWSSIFCLLIFNLIIYVIVRIPSAPDAPHQEVFLQAFGSSMRLFIACFAGIICSDLTNIYRITKLKFIFKGKYFIQRCLWVTAISEAIFNIVTYEIGYFGIIPSTNIYKLMFYSWALKMVYSMIMVFPLFYLINFLKKAEGIDTYDVREESDNHFETVLLKFLKIANPASEQPKL